MSGDMTKPTKWVCAQRRLGSAWASAPETDLEKQCRLGGFPGWSESSLGAHSFCWFCDVVAHMVWVLIGIISTRQFQQVPQSHDMTKPIIWVWAQRRSAKTPISLRQTWKNSVDPEQTAPKRAVWSEYTWFAIPFAVLDTMVKKKHCSIFKMITSSFWVSSFWHFSGSHLTWFSVNV